MRKIWQAIWNRRRFEEELAEEMRFHLEARAADLEQMGHTRAEAFRLDLLYAARGLRRNKVFAAVAIVTLTLGIGANAGIFALVNSVLLKTLPVPNPEELQAVY